MSPLPDPVEAIVAGCIVCMHPQKCYDEWPEEAHKKKNICGIFQTIILVYRARYL